MKTTFPFPLVNGVGHSLSGSTLKNIGHRYSVGVQGIGLLLDTLDQESPFEFRSYELQAVPTQVPRIDNSGEASEQTLGDWWTRGQHTWHGGSGQVIFDGEGSDRTRALLLAGLDIETPGKIKISLRENVFAVSVGNRLSFNHNGFGVGIDGGKDPAGRSHLVYWGNKGGDDNMFLVKVVLEGYPSMKNPQSGTSVALTGEGVACWDGRYLWTADTNTVARWDLRTGLALASSFVNIVTSMGDPPDLIRFVKGRLYYGTGRALREIDVATFTATSPSSVAESTIDPFYNHPHQAWKWKSITDTAVGIYFAGAVSDNPQAVSEIMCASLTAQDLSFIDVATIGALRTVWQSPSDEYIHEIFGIVGKQIAIGTSKGVRIATVVSEQGDLEVSPLIVETDQPVQSFAVDGKYLLFGWPNKGIGRIDLGDLSWSHSIVGTEADIPEPAGASGFRVLGLTMLSGVPVYITLIDTNGQFRVCHEADYLNGDVSYAGHGIVDVGEIRFGTFEKKLPRYFDWAGRPSDFKALQSHLEVFFKKDEENDFTEVFEINLDLQPSGSLLIPAIWQNSTLQLRLKLKTNGPGGTDSPELYLWRIRSEPVTINRFRHMVPIMIYDQMKLMDGTVEGRNGRAAEIVNLIEEYWRDQRELIFQRPDYEFYPKLIRTKVESFQFKEYAPHGGGEGFGGIGLLILKEVS